MMNNIPKVKIGIVAVSRDCFPIALSTDRKNRVCGELAQSGVDAYNCPTTVENEKDMEKALEEVRKAGMQRSRCLSRQFRSRDAGNPACKILYRRPGHVCRRCRGCGG